MRARATACYLQTLQYVSQLVSLPAHAGSLGLQHDLSLLGPSSHAHAPLMQLEAAEQLDPLEELLPPLLPPDEEDAPPPVELDELEELLVPPELQPSVEARVRTKKVPRNRIGYAFRGPTMRLPMMGCRTKGRKRPQRAARSP